MIFFGNHLTGEYILVGNDTEKCCIGASFSINQVFIFAIGKLLKMKTVMWWMGTDVLKLNTVWHYRWRYRAFSLFIDKHYAQSEWLRDKLKKVLKKEIEVRTIKPSWVHYDNSLLWSKRKT
jgi:hypothetical protein